jgi:hypothetical protein
MYGAPSAATSSRVDDVPRHVRRPVAAPTAVVDGKAALENDRHRKAQHRRNSAGSFLEQAMQQRPGHAVRYVIEVEVQEPKHAGHGEQADDDTARSGAAPRTSRRRPTPRAGSF